MNTGISNVTQNKTTNDSCYLIQRQQSNGSVFDYYTDVSMYENKNKCNDFTPPFIAYIPSGITNKSVELESDLKGITRSNSRCMYNKYIPTDPDLSERLDSTPLYKNNNYCKNNYKLLPNGYIN